MNEIQASLRCHDDNFVPPIGKTITGVWINQDRTGIKFAFSDNTKAYLYVDGDCCSESWIEHINDWEYALGSVIASTNTKDLGEVVATRQDCDRLYSAHVVVVRKEYPHKVSLDIEFRNSSNGYYGGDIAWFSGNSDNNDKWSPLTADF